MRSIVFAFVMYAIIYMNLSFSEHKGCVDKFCAVLSILYLVIKSALIQMYCRQTIRTKIIPLVYHHGYLEY